MNHRERKQTGLPLPPSSPPQVVCTRRWSRICCCLCSRTKTATWCAMMSSMPCPTRPTPWLVEPPTSPCWTLRSSWRSSSWSWASSSFSRGGGAKERSHVEEEGRTKQTNRNFELIPLPDSHHLLTCYSYFLYAYSSFWKTQRTKSAILMCHVTTFYWCIFFSVCFIGNYGVCHFVYFFLLPVFTRLL